MKMLRFRRRGCVLALFFLLASCVYLRGVLLYVLFGRMTLVARRVDFAVEKCPTCYGKSLCNETMSRLYVAPYPFDVVGVRKIDGEDEKSVIFVQEPFAHSGTRHVGSGIQSFFRCPTKRLERRIVALSDVNGNGDVTMKEKRTLATTLKADRESILLQLFPKAHGWPFLQYHGACGRVLVKEHGKHNLMYYVNESKDMRVWLAAQLLQIAFLLSDNNKNWAIYLPELRLDNFVLSDDGEVLAININNAIVVDAMNFASQPIHSKDEDPPLGDDIEFNATALCTGLHRDHNFIYMCRAVGRLLRSMATSSGNPISDHVRDCMFYRSETTRIDAARRLYDYLISLLPSGEDSKFFK